MNTSDRSAFIFSAVLHVLLLGGVAFVAYRSATRADAQQPLVMEMYAPPSSDAQETSFAAPPSDSPLADPAPMDPEPEAPAPELGISQPDIAIASPPAATFEALSKVPPMPEPEPEPAPEPTPAPAEQPGPQARPQQTAQARPQQTTPQPRVMTADQFRREVGMPRQAAAPAATRRSTTTTTTGRSSTATGPARINTDGIVRDLQNFQASGNAARVTQMSASDQNALHGYLSQFRTNIRASWVLPDSVTTAGEWAEVLITIEPDGRISSVRIGKHQGSKEFLSSIERAVRSARTPGPTPTRQREHIRYTLNLRDL